MRRECVSPVSLRRLAGDHLANTAPRRDQRKNVRFTLDPEVEHGRAVVIPGALNRIVCLLDTIDGESAQPVRFGETGEAGTGEWRAAIALALEQLLPLPHHA